MKRTLISVDTNRVVHPHFGGVGFQVCHHTFKPSKREFETVIAKRWKELNPSFARLIHDCRWDQAGLDGLAEHLVRFQGTGTEVYLTTWSPENTKPGDERKAYARKIVDHFEYLVRKKNIRNVKYYCMSNELTFGGWGVLARDLPTFKDYHQELFDELKARGLDIQLLATDAAPHDFWWTLGWAAQNMDGITGVYGAHDYFNRHTPESLDFYPWFLSQAMWGADVGQRKKKNFILGEFGCAQAPNEKIDGVRWDTCKWWGTAFEPLVGIQLAEAVLAALNAGIYAVANWTYMDFPDQKGDYQNKWGTFKWSGDDFSPRPHYYAYSLLTRYFRGPSTVFAVESPEPLVRAAAVKGHEKGTYSIAVVNRKDEDVAVKLCLNEENLSTKFCKHVYDPKQPPTHPFGDLPGAVGQLRMKDGNLVDTLASGTLTVYTTAFTDDAPDAVRGLQVESTPEGRRRVRWSPSSEPDLAYYRVYKSTAAGPDSQIGSTIANEFVDEAAGQTCTYKVVAVNQSGNAGPASSASP